MTIIPDPVSDPELENPTGLRISRRHFVIGATLAGASLAAQAGLPKVNNRPIDKKLFLKWIPRKFGHWTASNGEGIVLPPPDALADRLYDNLASLTYVRPDGASVMVVIAYNFRQDGVVQLHRPEVCYPTGGYTLSPTEAVSLGVAPGRTVPANFFSASGPQRVEQVLYWTRVGQRFPRTWIDQRLSVVRSNIGGSIPDGALNRFSIIGSDQADAMKELTGFVREFVAASNMPLRRIMLGGI